MIDIEIELAKTFGWSLYEIDETSIESLLPFIRRLTSGKRSKLHKKKIYADQAGWL